MITQNQRPIWFDNRPARASIGLTVFAAAVAFASTNAPGQWTQWGGPDRLFRASGKGLATTWPAEGPPRLWQRKLGEGYSAILADGGRLYTMYRAEEKEIAICLDAATGATLWEFRYESGPREGHAAKYGKGPRATPLLIDGRLYTVGVASLMHCLDARTGEVIWSHDLWREFGGNVREHGYASSPIAYRGTVLALVGGRGQSIVAFNADDGTVAWKSLSFENAYSSPSIVSIAGRDHLIAFMAKDVIGVDPINGELLWTFPFTNEWEQNVSTPVLTASNTFFVSTVLTGAASFRVVDDGGKFRVETLWTNPKVQISHVNTVQTGDYLFASSGTWAPYLFSAINVRTGEVAWRERAFPKANLLDVDGRLIMLDEQGNLALATATPHALTVHSQVKLLESRTWTVPTIAGNKLYVRDQEQIMALDLSRSAKGAEE